MKKLLVGEVIKTGIITCSFCGETSKECFLNEIERLEYSPKNYNNDFELKLVRIRVAICKDCIKQLSKE